MENLNYLSFPEKELKEIAEASRNNKLVFFIGAGFSKLSETELTKIPSWGELIDELKEDLGHPAENDYLKIAQLYYLKHGQHAYINKVKESIVDLDPSAFHESLFSLKPKYVITTNWDDLIEKTNKKIGLAYDVISSDEDLAQSQLDKKIIKMHGDFKQHNFVFKEDDYLQYSQNFPLIENYIKGIFSTCTVVFLGYSYSDYNLKQIVSWITNISKSTPKKYLLQRKFDEAQSLYLNNHGVSLLTSFEEFAGYDELYDAFFKSLNTAKDPYSVLIEINCAVEKKVQLINDDEKMTDSEKQSRKEGLNNFLIGKVTKIINERLSVLLQYNMLTPEQVSKKFSNCTIDYKYKNEITLEFHCHYLTNDYDSERRKINEMYIKNFIDNNFKDDIFRSALKKARVSHIRLNDKRYVVNFGSGDEYENEIVTDKLMFNMNHNDYDLYFLNGRYTYLLDEFALKVSRYILERNYIMATIYMANHDYIYNISKREGFRGYLVKSASGIINHKLYDYKNKTDDFPVFLKGDLQDLIEFLNFNGVYKSYYNFSVLSKNNKALVEMRRRNNIAFSDEEYTARDKLYPILFFIIGNEIIIDNYNETKELFESVLLESYEHYLMQDIFITNVVDFFIFIKYFKNNELRKLAHKLSENKKINEISDMEVRYYIHLRKYLVNALENICKLYKYKENYSVVTSLDKWLENILVLMGLVKWSKNKFNGIMEYIIPICENGSVSINFYDNFQYFLGVNWKLYETAYPSVLRLVDVFLIKIINDKFNDHDHSVIDGHKLSNTFTVSSNSGIIYENINLVEQAILKIKRERKELQHELVNGFFIYIRNIGTQEIKDVIDDFINDNILKIKPSTPSDYSMILFLLCNDYDIPEGFIDSLGKFIDKNVPRIFSEDGYRNYRLKSDLLDYLNFLINEKDMPEFKVILDKFNKKMEEAKK